MNSRRQISKELPHATSLANTPDTNKHKQFKDKHTKRQQRQKKVPERSRSFIQFQSPQPTSSMDPTCSVRKTSTNTSRVPTVTSSLPDPGPDRDSAVGCQNLVAKIVLKRRCRSHCASEPLSNSGTGSKRNPFVQVPGVLGIYVYICIYIYIN